MVDMEVGVANREDKIMTATSSNQELEVSVSFGKFENDSLSWEKFSSFSPNTYLEEVEKCATPGSVAQKKAYFESHYKKVTERRADIIMEQDKLLERNASFWSSVQYRGDTNSENYGSMVIESSGCDGSNGESTVEEDNLETGIATEVNETCHPDTMKGLMDVVKEFQSSVDAEDNPNALKMEKHEEIVHADEKPELIVQMEDNEKPEEVVCLEEEIKEEMKEYNSSKVTGEMKEMPTKEIKKEKDHNLIKKTNKNVLTNHTRGSPKRNQVTKKPVASKIASGRKTQPSKEKSVTKISNKAASPVSKAPGFSTPRVSKTTSTIGSSMSTSRSSVKKETVSTLPRKKQTTQKSLPISLNLDQSDSDPSAVPTIRKSLIMERMGDKDIVRRAFKTFQKSYDQMESTGDGKDTAPKQVPAKATSVSRLATNGRLAKSDDKETKDANSQRSSSFVPKSNGTAEKQNKLGVRAVEKIRLPAKPKAVETNAKTRRQSLNPEGKSMQAPLPKGSSHKVV